MALAAAPVAAVPAAQGRGRRPTLLQGARAGCRVDRNRYSRMTIEGDKKTEWICGCFLTGDDYFKFCQRHNESLKKAVLAQIDELDMTMVVAEGRAHDAPAAGGDRDGATAAGA